MMTLGRDVRPPYGVIAATNGMLIIVTVALLVALVWFSPEPLTCVSSAMMFEDGTMSSTPVSCMTPSEINAVRP